MRIYESLLGKTVRIGELEGEITAVIGGMLEVTFFDEYEGKRAIPGKDIGKYLID